MDQTAQSTAYQIAMEGIDYVCLIGSGTRRLDEMSIEELQDFKRDLVDGANKLAAKVQILIDRRTGSTLKA